ncbi:S8 family serine peptidase [Ruminococcus albus]|uniref:Lactocepin n=1 Tax=Ruminococcus albus TaxID=1264 RepID=A0A1H7PFJ3_RUMAL|nr:S8 family serine peptidase [Ruminococcus albus]SEL34406.1 lactocepin [Ruminococcus albus]
MNKELFKRMAGLISAIAITASSVLPSAAQALETTDTCPEYDDIVHVIVELYGDPILAADTGDMGSDYLDTSAAQRRSQQLKSLRKNAFSEILSIYPDAELDFTYDAVFNGFSCTLPSELIDEAEDLPAIKNVTVSHKNQAPDLYKSVDATGAYYFSSETGLTGKGKVIAVIDTELRTDHEMFAPLADESSVKLTKADIADAAENRNLNFDIDPDSAYVSSKIPYAISLLDNKNRYTVSTDNEMMYHGTHVCGIAAGNRVKPYIEEYENYMDMSGVAPDAQLIFMAGFEQNKEYAVPTIDDNVAFAGIEDAIKLGADVVSLSFGGPFSDDEQVELYSKVLNNADNAGVVICCAGGNEGWPTHTPENVERCSLNSPGFIDGMFTIAAASLSLSDLNLIKLADGTELPCSIMSQRIVSEDTEYEFVYCGEGSEEELKAADINGKIALVDCYDYDIDLFGIAEAVEKAGAAGLVYCSTEDYYYNPYYESDSFFIIVTDNEGSEIIKSQEDHRLFFRTDFFDKTISYNMGDFSSHGSLQTLDLKPDISAPGEAIYSASYDGYEYMDGTSMATPFAAGCSALAGQYIEENGWEVSGAEKVRLVKDLLMNSADQICVSDIPYSPRLQGAGLVDLADLANCSVTMTNNGKASVCLGDKVGDNFSFDVTLHNYGSSNVVFNKAELEMICETTEFSEMLNDTAISDTPAVLGSSAKYSVKKAEVPAGGEITFTVSVALDADDVNDLNSVFTNGWFTDGYLTLSGADNCSDISIPITGFHGDWNAPPIIGYEYTSDKANTLLIQNVLRTRIGSCRIPASLSIAKALSLYKERAEEDYCPDLDPSPRNGYVISPNVAKTMDFMCYHYLPNRRGLLKGYELTDENGNVVYSGDYEESLFTDTEYTLAFYPDQLNEILKDGKYYLNLTTELFQGYSEKVPQKKSIEITVDTEPPVLSNISIKKEKGRKILTVTAEDPELEGFYIIGTGKGSVKGSSDKSGYTFEDIKRVLQLFDPTGFSFSGQGGVGSYGRNSISSATIDDVLDDIRLLEPENLEYDFFDAVPAEPDENGCMTIEYDITDLTDYSLNVADRGYNIATYSEELPLVNNIPGVIEVREDTPISKIPRPTYSFDGKVTSARWEYYSYGEGEWKPLKISEKLDGKYHGQKLRYAVYSGDKAGYSNPAIISLTDRLMIHVSVYTDGQLLMDDTMLPGQYLDREMFSYDPNISYRVVMEAEGYVTRVMEFKGGMSPEDIRVYVYRLGDVNGDKSINISDITRTAAFVKYRRMFSDYEMKVADVNHDGIVNITDVIRIAAKVKGKRDFS